MSINYKVFAGTADILVYFFERAIDILRPNGISSMITSNKFVKANYGKNLRIYLKQFQIINMIDFGELPVFDEAATFPAIYFIQKSNPVKPVLFTQIKSLKFESLADVVQFNQQSLPENALGDDVWSLANKQSSSVLDKMKSCGISLGDYIDNKIYRGVLTGFNKAFVIDEQTRNMLITKDPKSAEIIYPFAIGDDIRFFHVKNNNKYLIVTKIGIDISRYPAIFEHLSTFKDDLEKRWDKGNHWYELRACAYYDAFEKPKIIYPDIAKESRWTFVNDPLFIGNTAYFIPSSDLSLLAIMNSKAVYFFYSQIAAVLGDASKGGRLRWFSQDVIKIPIPKLDILTKTQLAELAQQILDLKKQTPCSNTTALESKINQIVYHLYDLTAEEIKIVEGE